MKKKNSSKNGLAIKEKRKTAQKTRLTIKE
jgi:hypothetical protein